MWPSCTAPRVVVIVGYGIADYVTDALELADEAYVERERLPFPTTRQRAVDRVPTARSTSTSCPRSSAGGKGDAS